jgi:hypothetical protein
MTAQEKLLMERLKEPFPAEVIDWRPGSVHGDKALALAFVDARAVQDRLDDVFGLSGWQTKLVPLDDGCFVCELSVLVGDTWITRSDTGEPNDHGGSAENRRKGAASDALKRAAVRFGIGRYLYELERIYHPFDTEKRRLKKPYPALPVWALPKVLPPEELYRRAMQILVPEAKKGWDALQKAYEDVLSKDMRRAVREEMAALKKEAEEVDNSSK